MKKVKVGYKTYQLVEGFGTDDGQASHRESKIHLDSTLTKVDKANTLIHEILHCVAHVWSLYPTDEEELAKEEALVNAMANGLVTVFLDNPKVLKELQKLLDV